MYEKNETDCICNSTLHDRGSFSHRLKATTQSPYGHGMWP